MLIYRLLLYYMETPTRGNVFKALFPFFLVPSSGQ